MITIQYRNNYYAILLNGVVISIVSTLEQAEKSAQWYRKFLFVSK